jgi:uncharacterized protein involved in response to NO
MLQIDEPRPYRYAFHHLGFRPFFLLAGVFAVFVVATWAWLYHGEAASPLNTALPPVTWHAHEMLYGYALAVIAGFLLTAVRNWTGVQTMNGAPLLLLAGVWLLARLMPFLQFAWALPAMAVLDLVFGVGLCLAVLHPLIKVRQWSQLGVVAKIVLLPALNLVFYLGLLGMLADGVRLGLYGGLYLVVSLVLMMGRRVIPFFIERGVTTPVTLRNYRWLDISSLVLMLVFIVVEVFIRVPWLATPAAAALALLYAVRLHGWYTAGLWQKPLLWSLYLAYAWIAAGFLLRALGPMTGINPMLSIHAFSYGGIGLMTLGMMARVALGHTGRNVFEPPAAVTWMLLALLLGSFVRVLLPLVTAVDNYTLWIGVSQGLWLLAFAWFSWIYAPMLIKPRVDGRYG